MNNKNSAFTWLAATLLPLAILAVSADLLVFDAQTHQELLAPEAMPATLKLLDYFRGTGQIPQMFSAEEQSHLADVKKTIKGLHWTALGLLAALLLLLPHARQEQALIRGFAIMAAFSALLTIMPFESVFQSFHQALFAPGTWLFPPESALIRMYPFSFFQEFLQRIIISALATASILALWAHTSIVQHHKT